MTMQAYPMLHALGGPMAFPSSHVVVKTVGDPFTLQWGVGNSGGGSGYARLVIYEVTPSGAVLRGGTAWVEVPPGASLPLDTSGAVNTAWSQGAALNASLRLEGAISLAAVAAGQIILVGSHDFTLTVNPPIAQAPDLVALSGWAYVPPLAAGDVIAMPENQPQPINVSIDCGNQGNLAGLARVDLSIIQVSSSPGSPTSIAPGQTANLVNSIAVNLPAGDYGLVAELLDVTVTPSRVVAMRTVTLRITAVAGPILAPVGLPTIL
mgnify:CR=1 FL=1